MLTPPGGLTRHRAVGTLAVTLLTGPALLAVAPRPASTWQSLRHATASADPTAPLLALVGLGAWALTACLLTGVLLTAAGRLPGLLGRLCAAVAARTVPAVIRRTVGVALGAGLVLGPALPAQAVPAGDGPAGADRVTSVSLDWPIADVPPATPAAPAAAVDAPADPAATTAVVVRPGDTLWGLAEDALRAAGRTPTQAAVAASWPSWWAANRGVIGEDPDLLHPGTSLVAPPAS